MVGCEGDGHHAIVCEVEEGEKADKEEPEELLDCPLEAHHCIHYQCVIRGLNEHVWYFADNLHLHIKLKL